MSPDAQNLKILLTGATGYVGGRMLPRLEAAGYNLRCLARIPERLKPQVKPSTEVIKGDVLDFSSLEAAFEGINIAYYLVHSLTASKAFEREEYAAAENFGRAAKAAGVKKIIYLGGLGTGPDLSPHLASRQEVGRILRDSGVPTLEFRAGIIIGSGSFSFAMIRALVDRLPAMILPRWTQVLTQPIAVEDVLTYLEAAIKLDFTESLVVEIGAPEHVSYRELMQEYALQRGLKRVMISVPMLTPRLSSLWLGLVTPVYARVGRKLVEGLKNETVIRDQSSRELFNLKPLSYSEAIRRALVNEDQEFAQTRWSDALSSGRGIKSATGQRFGTRIVDAHTIKVERPPSAVFAIIKRLGGDTGWLYGNWLWKVRGWLDLLVGGVGLRRGRRDPHELRVGDPLDFWRVEAIEPDKLLRLAAEMKLPGRAWLQFEVERAPEGCIIHQTAIFDPLGLGGLIYWYALYPIHRLMFKGMLRAIGSQA
jgi:uncharacterized protein YbjT (DUF2867 family)